MTTTRHHLPGARRLLPALLATVAALATTLGAASCGHAAGAAPAGASPVAAAGPAAASAAFRVAVPDLTCELADLDVTGDRVTARLVFRGTATGTFRGARGGGGPIRFDAVDIQHVGAGDRITEDWHLEDNQTFAQQFAARG